MTDSPAPASAAPQQAPAAPAQGERRSFGGRPGGFGGGRPGGDRGPRRDRGPRVEEPKEFEESVLQIDRVSRMMKGGRRMSFRAVVVIGNKKGKVGFGMGKASEVQAAVQKAVRSAKKKLVTIPLNAAGSVPHETFLKFKSAQVWIAPAYEGFGVLAGNAIRPIMELGGVKNIRSKNYGTRNKILVAQAVMQALSSLKK